MNHDSLRGSSLLTLTQRGLNLSAVSENPSKAFWSTAAGVLAPDNRTLYLVFDGESRNNRTGVVSPDFATITLHRVSFDPVNFTQVFTLVTPTNGSATMDCTFLDELPPLQPRAPGDTMVTGRRAFLPPPSPPPYPPSTFISAQVDLTALLGLNGDEFPTTWASDGNQYTGAGDNIQPSVPSVPYRFNSPASFFKVNASSPTEPAYPNTVFTLQGDPYPLSKTPMALSLCPHWAANIANIKSSGVLELNGTMLWGVTCFNYGDDPTFNRQRYGPAWIASSSDFGVTWVSQGQQDTFVGRLGAPRLVQAGRSNAGSPDPEYIYALFPGTMGDAAFFECNDAAWLGRAPAVSSLLPLKRSWEYFVGIDAQGGALWDADDSMAVPVLDWPLHTSVQQVNWHPSLHRYVLANWVWISMDGYPRPDHSPDEKHGRTARQRTWLMLLEAPNLWGPWSIFYSDSNWQYSDGSSGAYTPVFPPAWINTTDDSLWMVSTQCCTGANTFPPDNHYGFNAQKVTITRL
jgi:hypothetical protein